jgi:hypothetical protein
MSKFRLETESLDEKIRGLFVQLGGNLPHVALARACLDHGIFDEEMRHNLLIAGAARRCRNALRQKDEHGLPWAVTVDDHGTQKQRLLFRVEDYAFAIRQREHSMRKDYTIVLGLARECLRRYDVALPVPSFVGTVSPDDSVPEHP